MIDYLARWGYLAAAIILTVAALYDLATRPARDTDGGQTDA